MAHYSYTPVQLRAIRVTSLNASGAVDANSKNIVTDGTVNVTISTEVEEGNEITKKTTSGAICLSVKNPPSVKNVSAAIEFCHVNPQLYTMMSALRTYNDGGNKPAGMALSIGSIEKAFALELWASLDLGSSSPDLRDALSMYTLYPFMQGGVLGAQDYTADGAVSFKIEQMVSLGGTQWGKGPYNVVMGAGAQGGAAAPAQLPTALGSKDIALYIPTAVAPPAVNEEPQVTPVKK